jgi:hypothetical protein
MRKIDWARKLSSRKFWALVAGVASSVALGFGVSESEIAKITGIIGSVGSVAIYILAEAYVDGKAVEDEL